MTHITLLYTGDIHGQVDQLLRLAHAAQNRRYHLQRAGHHVFLFDTGDVEDRSLLESDVSKGAALFRLLKTSGYVASAVGNGAALAYGPHILHDIAHASDLPLLLANILTPESGPLPGTHPTLIIPCGLVRLGLIGLSNDLGGEYASLFGVTSIAAEAAAQHFAEQLREYRCDVVGILSHLGHSEDVALAKAVPGIDFILGGHSHNALPTPEVVNGTIICHSGSHGQWLGELHLEINEKAITAWDGTLHPIPADTPFHAETARHWHSIQLEIQTKAASVIGHLADPVDLAADRGCGMGQLLADALRVALNADVGLCIAGHVHRPLPAGPITLEMIARACSSPVHPAVAELSGAQIVHALEHSADPAVWQQPDRFLRGNLPGIMQVSGLTYHLDHDAPTGARVSDVRVMGRPLRPGGRYRVAATDYEFFPEFGYVPDLNPDHMQIHAFRVLREILEDHLRRFDPLTPGMAPRIHSRGTASVEPDRQ